MKEIKYKLMQINANDKQMISNEIISILLLTSTIFYNEHETLNQSFNLIMYKVTK